MLIFLDSQTVAFVPISASIELTVEQFEATAEFWLVLNKEWDEHKDDLFEVFKDKDTNQDKGTNQDKFEQEYQLSGVVPIPGLSFTIPEFILFGISAQMKLHSEVQWFARFNFSFGGTGTLPKGAKIPIDLFDPFMETLPIEGFSGATFHPFFHMQRVVGEASLNSWIVVLLSGGFQFLGGVRSLGMELEFRAPRVNLNFSTGFGTWNCRSAPKPIDKY